MNYVGIVSYNPDITRLSKSIESLVSQNFKILIVDNNSENINDLIQLTRKYDLITLHKNNKNYGVAKALNQIVEYFTYKDATWVLLMDQDSVLPENAIEKYNKYIGYEQVAIICPSIHDDNDKRKKNNNIDRFVYVNQCITSGSLINVNVCNLIGKFDEIMFIDLVDFDYSVRVISNHYKILKMEDVILSHRLGNLRILNFGIFKINVTNHSPIRIYYQIRNYKYLQKKHPRIYTKLFVRKKTFFILIKIIFFEKKKFSKIKYFLKGIKDSKKMTLGR